MLDLVRIVKKYGSSTIVDHASCRLPDGINVIIGLNGSGKSTLLKIAGGFIRPDEGQVLLNEKDITALDPEDRGIGYVPQQSCLFPHLTVEANVAYGLRNGRGTPETVQEAMRLLDIEQYRQAKPHELSGGFQSRVALARSLASAPRALLLDEPLSDADQAIKERIIPKFRTVLDQLHIPVLYVTHDLQEAQELGERFHVITHGILQPVASAAEAFSIIRTELLASLEL